MDNLKALSPRQALQYQQDRLLASRLDPLFPVFKSYLKAAQEQEVHSLLETLDPSQAELHRHRAQAYRDLLKALERLNKRNSTE